MFMNQMSSAMNIPFISIHVVLVDLDHGIGVLEKCQFSFNIFQFNAKKIVISAKMLIEKIL